MAQIRQQSSNQNVLDWIYPDRRLCFSNSSYLRIRPVLYTGHKNECCVSKLLIRLKSQAQ